MPAMTMVSRSELGHLARPSGWFQIGWSHEYEPGQVRPLRYFGEDLVAYRTAAGQLIVATAYCPHFGAHLGYGGAVEGECLRCPFHGWTWGPDGHNVAIPYSSRVNRSTVLRQHVIREQSGLILLWHDADGAPPSWEPPAVPELAGGPGFYPAFPGGVRGWLGVRLYPQLVLENNADFAHFRFVHGWEEMPMVHIVEASSERFHACYTGTVVTRRGDTSVTIDSTSYGVGLTLARLTGFRDTVNLTAVTPADGEHSDVLLSVAVQRLSGDGDEMPSVVDSIRNAQLVTAFQQDIPIWEHQQYNLHPPFPKEEAAHFVALRRWSEQFYPASLGFTFR
jgi:3-ketosteroid 9alpha-monooxygenase subunit A